LARNKEVTLENSQIKYKYYKNKNRTTYVYKQIMEGIGMWLVKRF